MPQTNEPPPYAIRPYIPPQYLLARTGLSQEDIITQYEAFRQSLQFTETAPELVFERLVGNLMEALTGTGSQPAAIAPGPSREMASAKPTEQPNLITPSPTLSLTPIPPTGNQTYLQFSFIFIDNKPTRVCGATTTTQVPYGIGAGHARMHHIAHSAYHGNYDSRMDALITTPTVPTSLTQIIRFPKPFETPPKVAVWLTGLSSETGSTVGVRAGANNITETMFELQINSGDGARLGSVGAAWAVWPKVDRDREYWVQAIGSVSTTVLGTVWVPMLGAAGEQRQATHYENVALAAVCWVDLILEGSVWVEVEVKKRDNLQLRWEMSAGPGDALFYSVRLVYVLQ